MRRWMILLLFAVPLWAQQKSVQDIENIRYKHDLTQIGKSAITGKTPVFRFGFNSAVGATNEDISNLSTSHTYPSTHGLIDIVSGNANDDSAGTGLRRVTVVGLDSNWAYQTEMVALVGSDTVSTTKYFIRVWEVYADTAGSGGVAIAAVKVQNAANTVTYAQIDVGETSSFMAMFTVPASKTFYLKQIFASTDVAKTTLVGIFVRAYGTGVFKMVCAKEVYLSGCEEVFQIPMSISAKSDVVIRAKAGGGGGDVAAGFGGWYE